MRAVVVLVSLSVLACVGGDGTGGAPQGALGGPCFSNGTCNAGLACVLEGGRGVCEQPDATVDAPAGDVGPDSPPTSCPPPSPSPGAVTCAPTTCTGQDCCVDTTLTKCKAAGDCAAVDLACDEAADCGTGLCCVPATLTGGDCNKTLALETGAKTSCAASCPTGSVQLCASSSECGAGRCEKASSVLVDTVNVGEELGVCVP